MSLFLVLVPEPPWFCRRGRSNKGAGSHGGAREVWLWGLGGAWFGCAVGVWWLCGAWGSPPACSPARCWGWGRRPCATGSGLFPMSVVLWATSLWGPRSGCISPGWLAWVPFVGGWVASRLGVGPRSGFGGSVGGALLVRLLSARRVRVAVSFRSGGRSSGRLVQQVLPVGLGWFIQGFVGASSRSLAAVGRRHC